ncbi:class A beta-lactamase-related serine hydrolase [Ktedonosporobacter rubrisoli]|uniref:Class A beta-lactamase-related serine hydrolase n=1 Tax=Ktedonosporobacter rubrisoli TaxID=2509675 RepID=A0A4P6JIQ4_KTERU|nr:class A beta-lactamase-related serine hydrolase [Ktedonosporobacter rubrisoli]
MDGHLSDSWSGCGRRSRKSVTIYAGIWLYQCGQGSHTRDQQTLFRIASTTKPLVGIALMRLVERGTLTLDLHISTYLPWLHLSQPRLSQQITLRHLLSHTSGLCQFPQMALVMRSLLKVQSILLRYRC